MRPLQKEITEGRIIAERYRCESVLGVGGLATVWRAVDTRLQRPVAIKVLDAPPRRRRPEQEAEQRDQFLREARLVAAVQHPNVVRVLDFGPLLEGGAFMAMELFDGGSLSDRMTDSALSVPEAVGVIVGVLSGLAAVHDAGITHRDLKPENVFMAEAEDGTFPVLLDFGISQSHGHARGLRSVHPTLDGILRGTPEYMAPEQARGDAGDPRTDVYAAGVLAYELLTGQLPFEGETPFEVLTNILNSEPTPILSRTPHLSLHLAEVVEKALQRDPLDRYPGAREMRLALLGALERATAADELIGWEPVSSERGWRTAPHETGAYPATTSEALGAREWSVAPSLESWGSAQIPANPLDASPISVAADASRLDEPAVPTRAEADDLWKLPTRGRLAWVAGVGAAIALVVGGMAWGGAFAPSEPDGGDTQPVSLGSVPADVDAVFGDAVFGPAHASAAELPLLTAAAVEEPAAADIDAPLPGRDHTPDAARQAPPATQVQPAPRPEPPFQLQLDPGF